MHCLVSYQVLARALDFNNRKNIYECSTYGSFVHNASIVNIMVSSERNHFTQFLLWNPLRCIAECHTQNRFFR